MAKMKGRTGILDHEGSIINEKETCKKENKNSQK
jgi:hypothetical protein